MIRLIAMKSQGGRRCLKTILSLQPQQQSLPLAFQYLLQQPFHTQTLSAAAAATTGAQKRALQHNQISPSTKVPPGGGATPPPPPTAAAAKPTTTIAPSSDNSNTIMIGAAVAAGAVGAGYYYYTTANTTSTPAATATKKEDAAPAVSETVPTDEPKEVAIESPATVTTQEVPTPSTSVTDDKENRVTSIIVPPKMKNTLSGTGSIGTVVEVEDHPPLGNRVTNVFSPPPTSNHTTGSTKVSEPEPEPVTSSIKNDTKSTHEAIQELQSHTTASAMESLISSHQSMWTNREMTADTENASNPSAMIAQLQQRIGQLQYELQDRTKWEAIRLKEFLIMKEKEVTDQYLELMQKQRLEFEDLMAKKLREQEHVLSQQLYRAIQEKEATIQSVLSTAFETQKQEYEEEKKAWEEMTSMNIQAKFEDQYLQQLEEYKNHMTKVLQEKVRQMQGMADKLQQLQAALDASQTSKEGSLKAHRISAAALALTEKLESHHSAKTELETLKLAAGNVGVISTACATLPSSVASTGVPTLSELQTHFMNSVQPKCRQAAFVPKGRVGLEGQLAGMLFATLRYAPSYDDAAPESDSDNAEYVLVRASRYVQLGELETAVDELDKLSGQPAFVVVDWKKNAIDRINVEKALKVIKMECALLNESCLE